MRSEIVGMAFLRSLIFYCHQWFAAEEIVKGYKNLHVSIFYLLQVHFGVPDFFIRCAPA